MEFITQCIYCEGKALYARTEDDTQHIYQCINCPSPEFIVSSAVEIILESDSPKFEIVRIHK